MTIKIFFQLLKQNFLLLLAGGLLTATAAYWLVSKQKQDYTSQALVSTGIISSISIKNTEGGKSTDRDYAQNELENLVSLATAHKTREELATRLLARYLTLGQVDRRWISQEEFDFLQEEVFTAEMKALRDTSFAGTLARLTSARDAAEGNDIQKLIYSDDAYFGIEYLEEHLSVYRRGNSDLLEFNYTTSDAALCRQTLNELLTIFMDKHGSLKKNQSSEVSGFFAGATTKSANRLQAAENELLQFRVQNNIINYEEQTRTITIKKEDLDDLRTKENMNLQGVAATRLRVEQELGNRASLSEINENLMSLRKELTLVSGQLAKIEIAGADETAIAGLSRKRELEARQDELREQMSRVTQQSYDFENSSNGVQTQNLLDEWLDAVVTEEQSIARLGVIGDRQQEFTTIYSQYAPWGSKLNELQRKIELAEEEYLANLHSYNQALLHQQHTMMATNLVLIDSPYLPIAKPDYKRFLLVIMGFIGGTSLVLGALIALAFLDDSLKNPDVLREKIGVNVATVLPNMVQAAKSNSLLHRTEAARQQAMALLLQQIKVETLQKDSPPKLILITSTRQEEGKSWVAEQIADFLREEDNRVLYLYPNETGVLPTDTGKENLGYEMSSRMLDAENIEELAVFGEVEPYLEVYHYVILEIPALLTGKYPLPLLRKFDLSLLVCRANRSWEEADQQALSTLQRASRSPIRAVLNGADMDVLEVFMGELSGPRHSPVLVSKPKGKPYEYDR